MTEKDTRPAFEDQSKQKRKYTRKPKIVVTADSVDMEGISDDERKLILARLLENEQVVEDLKPAFGDQAEALVGGNVIQEKHVDFFLDVIQGVERVLIPKMIARKSVMGMPAGKFQIEPQVAAKCFTFTREQRYGVNGTDGIVQPSVDALNKSLPPKIKALIAKVGPGSIAVQRLLQALMQQQATAFQMQLGLYAERAKSQRPNGVAHQTPTQPQSQPHPEQPSQDISAPTA